MRKLVVRSNLVVTANDITCTAHGVDQLDFEIPVDLASQSGDVTVDGIGLGIEMHVPDAFEQHRAGDALAAVLHQIFQQAEPPRLQLDQPPGPAYGAGERVELEVG